MRIWNLIKGPLLYGIILGLLIGNVISLRKLSNLSEEHRNQSAEDLKQTKEAAIQSDIRQQKAEDLADQRALDLKRFVCSVAIRLTESPQTIDECVRDNIKVSEGQRATDSSTPQSDQSSSKDQQTSQKKQDDPKSPPDDNPPPPPPPDCDLGIPGCINLPLI